MTDSNQGKKKRITICATPEGVEIAQRAMIRLGFNSKSNFAKSNLLARSSVTKFFGCEPIQLDTFKKICIELRLDWRVIAGLAEQERSNLEIVQRSDSNLLEPSAGGEQMQQPKRQVTVIDQQTKQIKAVIVLECDINSEPNFKVLQSILREYSGDTIKIKDIEIGSIRLIIEGSHEDIERLISRFRAEEIKNLDEFSVEDIHILRETDEENRELNDKWRLVQEIVTQKVRGRQLQGADLSDADLKEADLREADLSGADLSGADLSGADLSGANLRRADLSGADLSLANLSVANLIGTNLIGTNLIGTYVREAKLIRANLRWANLRWANLIGADLSGADLSAADLIGADLSAADLSDANLRRADLRRANLSGANLSGANLSGADIKDTRFGDNLGISQSMKLDLINRGAIFEDSPGDRSGVLTGV